MRKSTVKKTRRPIHRMVDEKTEPLKYEISEEYRQPMEMESEPSNTANWSEAQDRSEDLATMKDPFIQQPERGTEIPPELTQQRTGETLQYDENLADRFDAERRSPPL